MEGNGYNDFTPKCIRSVDSGVRNQVFPVCVEIRKDGMQVNTSSFCCANAWKRSHNQHRMNGLSCEEVSSRVVILARPPDENQP